MPDIHALVDEAFDYRGDVTLDLKDGAQIVGYVSNRYPKGTSSDPTPRLEVMIEGQSDKRVIQYAEIADIHLTGEDAAAGKSWEEWVKRQAKAETKK